MTKPVCLIIGVGPGNGAAFARKFAANGYKIAIAARNIEYLNTLANKIDDAKAYRCDVTDTDQLADVIRGVQSDMGPIEILIYNAGSGIFSNFDQTTVENFERSWRVNTLGLFMTVHQILPAMRSAGSGTILITGATASLRGNTNTAAFASAKAAQRSLAQSIAKSAGLNGIHVAYVILDGIVDSAQDRDRLSDSTEDRLLKSTEIADTFYQLSQQHRSAWTFELDLRPYAEKWS